MKILSLRYRYRYKAEQALRASKSDLKEEAIKPHLSICIIALAEPKLIPK